MHKLFQCLSTFSAAFDLLAVNALVAHLALDIFLHAAVSVNGLGAVDLGTVADPAGLPALGCNKENVSLVQDCVK